jgi:hypothetical protein
MAKVELTRVDLIEDGELTLVLHGEKAEAEGDFIDALKAFMDAKRAGDVNAVPVFLEAVQTYARKKCW